jgi:hypothetical protein
MGDQGRSEANLQPLAPSDFAMAMAKSRENRLVFATWLIFFRDHGAMTPRDRNLLTVVKLSDYGGQYVLLLKCSACGHSREARPDVFARFAGWEASLASVVERLRCSKCGVRRCTATARREMKRDG